MNEIVAGQVIGIFTIIEVTNRVNKSGNRLYRVNCSCCNKEKDLTKCVIITGKSCGCLRYASTCGTKRWKGIGELNHGYFRKLWHGAKQRSIPVNITLQQMWKLFLAQNRRCALTGELLTLDSKDKLNDGTASLDRIDSSKGYTIDNIQWVHKIVNFMKRNEKQCDFIDWCRKVVKHNGT